MSLRWSRIKSKIIHIVTLGIHIPVVLHLQQVAITTPTFGQIMAHLMEICVELMGLVPIKILFLMLQSIVVQAAYLFPQHAIRHHIIQELEK